MQTGGRTETTSRSVIKSAAILGAAGIVCRFLGVIYRIPLSNILGTGGMGNYQLTHTVFSLLMTIVTGGIPIAISRLVAGHTAKGDYASAHRYFDISLKFLLVFGAMSSIVLAVFAQPISKVMGMENAYLSVRMMAPAVFLVAITSAYKGYYQGIQKMGPSAFSQLTEQGIKMVLGLYFARMFIARGEEYGAMGAIIGLVISEAAGFLVFFFFKDIRYAKKQTPINGKISKREGLKTVLTTALPLTIGQSAMSILSSIDSAMAMSTLLRIGYSQGEATSLYGLYTGFVLPLISLPTVFSASVSMSIVPAITAARANGQKRLEEKQVRFGFKAAMLLGLPIAVGFFVLAEPILGTLYKSLTAEELRTAVKILKILSPGVLFLVASQILAGVLQGLGRISLPVTNMIFGAIIKLTIGEALLGVPKIGIYGAAIGTVLCYGVGTILNGIGVIKYGTFKFSWREYVTKPLLCSGFMAIALVLSYNYLPLSVGARLLASVLVGVLVYLLGIYFVGALESDELGQIMRKRRH